MRPQYTDSQLEEIANWSIGRNVRDTCDHFGCGARVVLKARMKFVDPEASEWKPGPVPKEVKPDLKEQMQFMRDSGMSIREVAVEVGKPRSFVDKHTTTKNSKADKVTDEDLQLMQELRDAGLTLCEIAEKFEVCAAYVQKRTMKNSSSMPISTFNNRARYGTLPDHPIEITACGEVIGTFTPKNSAH